MARKSLQDLSGIASTIARSGPRGEKATKTSAPALGALQGSLASIREIDPDMIDDWGPADRLDGFTVVNTEDTDDGFDALKDSMRSGGQQVPILVRKGRVDGRFEVIYGRRRLRACRDLGIKVRANVQDLDDATALLAKGLENAARRNLSFYEKARFAAAIQEAGHDTATVRQVLNLTASGLSHLTKVTQSIPNSVGDAIGPAPKAGRPKWTALADAFRAGKLTEKLALKTLERLAPASSDALLDGVLKAATKRGTRETRGGTMSPVDGVTIKSMDSGVTLSAKRRGKNAAFADWLDDNLADIITRSYAEFTSVNPSDDT